MSEITEIQNKINSLSPYGKKKITVEEIVENKFNYTGKQYISLKGKNINIEKNNLSLFPSQFVIQVTFDGITDYDNRLIKEILNLLK